MSRCRFFKMILGLVPLLVASGCSMVSSVMQQVYTQSELEYRYGVISISQPKQMPLRDIESAIDVDVQKLSFEAALAEAAKFQSAAYRQRQVRQQLDISGSADLYQAQLLGQALASGAAPPQGSTTAPALPAVTKLTPFESFMATGSEPVSVPYRGRIQTAFNNVLMAKLGASQLSILKKMDKDWDMRLVFSTMTIMPGELTRKNSAAELRVRWKLDVGGRNAPESAPDDMQVIPIFPTYDSAAELNNAAAMNEFQLFLAAMAQYGPAKAQGGYQAVINDVQRLISATERVTLIGSPLPDNTIQYRISGLRAADPLNEKKPSGSTQMQPLTLPVVDLVMIRKDALKHAYKDKSVDISMEYSSRWRRDRPWWDVIPPGTPFPGFWYDRGTRFQQPVSQEKIKDAGFAPKSYFPWQWPDKNENQEFIHPTVSALKYRSAIQIKPEVSIDPIPFNFEPQEKLIDLQHPFDQFLVVRATGDQPKVFYLEQIKVEAQKVSEMKTEAVSNRSLLAQRNEPDYDTYVILLSAETLRNLAKVHGIKVCDDDMGMKKANDEKGRPGFSLRKPQAEPEIQKDHIVELSAVNAAGPSNPKNNIKLNLAFECVYPVSAPPETLNVDGEMDGKPYRIDLTRRAGQVWPPDVLNFLQKKVE